MPDELQQDIPANGIFNPTQIAVYFVTKNTYSDLSDKMGQIN